MGSQWGPNGVTVGSQWGPNGVPMGSLWGPNGVAAAPPQAAAKLIRVFAEQIFYTGFIHADPHPGNGQWGHGVMGVWGEPCGVMGV